MFTYLRQPRRIRLLASDAPPFPAHVAITYKLAPAQLFGIGEGPVRAIRLGSDYTFLWDANTDRGHGRPDPGFLPVEVAVPALSGTLAVSGNRFTYAFHADNEEILVSELQFLHFVLPATISAVLTDPVYVEAAEGVIGATQFRIEHVRSISPVTVLSDELLASRIRESLGTLSLLHESANVRLVAGTRYVHTASRLLAAGFSPWEFMAEALLNYSKTLEVLFGASRDEQRAGLRSVGVPDEDIEGRFIPVTLLRDFLDVAHPKLAQLDSPRLEGLYLFLVGVESDFKGLIARISKALMSGSWILEPGSGVWDTRDLKSLDRILQADAARRAKLSQADA